MPDKNLSIEELFNLALQEHKKNNFNIAKKYYEKILESNPNEVGIYNNLGTISIKLEEYEKAVYCFKKAISLDSNNTIFYNNLGVALKHLSKLDEAAKAQARAIEIDADNSDAHNNLGIIYRELNKYDQAIASYEKAISINSRHADAHSNIGIILKEIGKHSKAIEYYEKAIEINKNHIDAHYNLGHILLLCSNFEKGFEEYEWRLKQPLKHYNDLRLLTSKEWNGEDLKNKKILIVSEQGIGDIIQFSRYLYILKNNYFADVIFKTYKNLSHLYREDELKIISNEDSNPDHDYHKYLLSLPGVLFKKEKKIPKEINYIKQNHEIYSKWKEKLSHIKGLKIGINWQGNKNYKYDQARSIPLHFFGKLFNLKGVNFINLQKGPGVQQINSFQFKNKLYDFSNQADNNLNAFEDTIGILKNLDLIISSDTALPHLSATLGLKTWIMLPFSPDWRFFLNTNLSPWYEQMKLYRQKKCNDWNEVFMSVKKDLINEFKLEEYH